MKLKFTSINSASFNIKLNVNINKSKPKKFQKFKKFLYNQILYFEYCFHISTNGIIDLTIIPNNKLEKKTKYYIGYFIYDYSIKFVAENILLNCEIKALTDQIVFEFKQKDFIYNRYKNSSIQSNFNCSYKLSNDLNNLHLSLNFLKKLVSEPSNSIYPESFAKIAFPLSVSSEGLATHLAPYVCITNFLYGFCSKLTLTI